MAMMLGRADFCLFSYNEPIEEIRENMKWTVEMGPRMPQMWNRPMVVIDSRFRGLDNEMDAADFIRLIEAGIEATFVGHS
jgi:hypothetical protein